MRPARRSTHRLGGVKQDGEEDQEREGEAGWRCSWEE